MLLKLQGLLKELVLLPGSDISRLTCPSPTPHLPDIPHPDMRPPHVDHPHTQCTYSDTGRLNYDFHKNTLQVCFSGIWQEVVTQTGEKMTTSVNQISEKLKKKNKIKICDSYLHIVFKNRNYEIISYFVPYRDV